MQIRKKTIPVLSPTGGKEEINAIAKTIRSGWWGRGSQVEELEKKFAKLVKAKYAVSTLSNTTGLDLVLKAYGINGGNIISPTVSWVTTAMVPLWNNCENKLCDINAIDRNLCPKDVKKLVNKNTKAIISVNYAGIQCNTKPLRKFFKGLIIEDCALSCYTPGAGKSGDVAIWSFQAVKTISCGDGGIITTNSRELYKKLKSLTYFGITQDTYKRATTRGKKSMLKPGYVWDFDVKSIGYKAYMNDLQASMLLAQLKKLKGFIKRRMQIQKFYNDNLPKEIGRPEYSGTCQFYSASVKKEYRAELMEFLAKKKIHTTVHYKPLHMHPIFKQKRKFPVADVEWEKFISFPCHSAMTLGDAKYIVYFVNKFFDKKNKNIRIN
jgi:dTDP-4-amino-4,6-dideoxygalactose transaminase